MKRTITMTAEQIRRVIRRFATLHGGRSRESEAENQSLGGATAIATLALALATAFPLLSQDRSSNAPNAAGQAHVNASEKATAPVTTSVHREATISEDRSSTSTLEDEPALFELSSSEPVPDAGAPALRYFVSSTRKLHQLTGESDKTRGAVLTRSRTQSRFKVVTTDWAASFNHRVGNQRRTYFLFADLVADASVLDTGSPCSAYHCRGDDFLAWTTSRDPENVFLETYQDVSSGKYYLKACPPGATFCRPGPKAPLSGVSLFDQIFLAHYTEEQGRLLRATDNGQTFTFETLCALNRTGFNLAMLKRVSRSTVPSLPFEDGVLIIGNDYPPPDGDRIKLHVGVIPTSAFDPATADLSKLCREIRYLVRVGPDGPIWSKVPGEAGDLFTMGHVRRQNGTHVTGELTEFGPNISYSFIPEWKSWIMLNVNHAVDAANPHTNVYFYTASVPWGPWTRIGGAGAILRPDADRLYRTAMHAGWKPDFPPADDPDPANVDRFQLESFKYQATPCTGDTYLRLHNAAGIEVASNDDAPAGVGSLFSYTAPVTGNYELRAGCYANESCSGWFRWELPDREPDLRYYTAANTNSAVQNTHNETIALSAGDKVTVSSCGASTEVNDQNPRLYAPHIIERYTQAFGTSRLRITYTVTPQAPYAPFIAQSDIGRTDLWADAQPGARSAAAVIPVSSFIPSPAPFYTLAPEPGTTTTYLKSRGDAAGVARHSFVAGARDQWIEFDLCGFGAKVYLLRSEQDPPPISADLPIGTFEANLRSGVYGTVVDAITALSQADCLDRFKPENPGSWCANVVNPIVDGSPTCGASKVRARFFLDRAIGKRHHLLIVDPFPRWRIAVSDFTVWRLNYTPAEISNITASTQELGTNLLVRATVNTPVKSMKVVFTPNRFDSVTPPVVNMTLVNGVWTFRSSSTIASPIRTLQYAIQAYDLSDKIIGSTARQSIDLRP